MQQDRSLDSGNSLLGKVVKPEEAMDRAASLSGPVVFTNGVFDILHRGHVTYLAEAKKLGKSLVVAINDDASAKRLGKGPGRPFNKQLDRAVVLAGLASVDLVTFFSEDTPCELLVELRPDIYVKGGDYNMETLEETRLIRSWGGEAFALPFISGFSTTSLALSMGGE